MISPHPLMSVQPTRIDGLNGLGVIDNQVTAILSGAPLGVIDNQVTAILSGTLTDDQAQAVGKSLASSIVFANDLASALQPYADDDRQKIIAAYLAAGGTAALVGTAQDILASQARLRGLGLSTKTKVIWSVLATASMAASAYHGYKRNRSVGWALWWGLMGGLFPIITPTIALAQGFGKRK